MIEQKSGFVQPKDIALRFPLRNLFRKTSVQRIEPQLPPDDRSAAGLSVRDVALSTLAAMLLAVLMKIFIVEMFVIPTPSMESTLHIGDCIAVSKVSYSLGLPPRIPFTNIELPDLRWHYGNITRGDIVVFDFPEVPDNSLVQPEQFIKRVVGLPGDKVRVHNEAVWVNDERQPAPEEAATTVSRRRVRDTRPFLGPLTVPYAGMKISLSEKNLEDWRKILEMEGNSVDLRDGRVFLNNEFSPEYALRQNYYYVMGDNRPESYDSRSWGFVPEKNIIGKPLFIYWSFGESEELPGPHIRWDRIGRNIR